MEAYYLLIILLLAFSLEHGIYYHLLRFRYNNQVTTEAQHTVGMAMALPFLISALIIPLIGISIDKYGKRSYLLILAAAFGILTHVLFIFVTPIFPLVILGITYSIFAAVFWPCISLIVPNDIIVFIVF